MNIGMITCSYYMRIYDYKKPEDFHWGKMMEKYRSEFNRAEFVNLAQEIRAMGYDNLEIWEPHYSYFIYDEAEATVMGTELRRNGFNTLAYCIGGLRSADLPLLERIYRFAKALGANVVVGGVHLEEAEEILPELERCGKLHGLRFANENHPAPDIEKPEDIKRLTEGYETIGANMDVGIYNMQGFDVLAAAHLLRDRIYHVHFKDTMKGGHSCLPIGDGDAPLAQLARLLKNWGYRYMVSVELESPTDPATGLANSLTQIRKYLS